MSKSKLEKFAEMKAFPNVFQSEKAKKPELKNNLGEIVSMGGKWNEHFGNSNPITLELACGRGEYTVALARMFPKRNFIGIDVKGARLWKGAYQALENGLSNVAFVRAQIEHLDQLFEQVEVSEIWITFPDPHEKQSKRKKRLTSERFVDLYRKVLVPSGLIHLKTDSKLLFDFTLEIIEAGGNQLIQKVDDVWAMTPVPEELRIRTYYEREHLANKRTIRYLKFRLEGEF